MRWVRGVEQDITERGLRLDACGLADWVCEHLRAPPEDNDAWSFEGMDFTLAHAKAGYFRRAAALSEEVAQPRSERGRAAGQYAASPP